MAAEMKQPNLIPQFIYLIKRLAEEYPALAYIHLIEPRVNNSEDISSLPGESLDFAREAWKPTGRPFLVAGGYTSENALEHMKLPGRENDVVVFGRWFIANVRLVLICEIRR